MKYLPILQELLESDSTIIMVIGLALAVFVGIKANDIRKNAICLVSSFILYMGCELISNLHTNYLIELILLFAGTLAIGGFIGFLLSTVIVKIRKKQTSFGNNF